MPIQPDQLLDFSKELILVIDKDGKIAYANKTARIMLGTDDLLGHYLAQYLSNHNYYNVADKLLSIANNALLDEVLVVRSDGKEFYTNIRVCHLDETGKNRAIFLTDLTHRFQFRSEITSKVKVIENLSKSAKVRGGELGEALDEVLVKCTEALDVDRVNVWLIDDEFGRIDCVGSYTLNPSGPQLNTMKGQQLLRQNYPRYFSMLESEEVIITDDVLQDPQTAELKDNYIVPNGIHSMLDIPLRSDGRMIGVVCFEHTGPIRKWNVFEVKFGFLIAQVISLLLESYEKKKLLMRQHKLIREKESLMEEISYRVKYSFALMNALLNYHAEKYKDPYHADLFSGIKNQLQSISGIHEIIFEAKDYARIRFEKYIYRILAMVDNLYPLAFNMEPRVQMSGIYLPISKALPCAMIIGELMKNSYTRSFAGASAGHITIQMQAQGNQYQLVYADNGTPMDEDFITSQDLSLNLVEYFVKDLGATMTIEVKNGNRFSIIIPA